MNRTDFASIDELTEGHSEFLKCYVYMLLLSKLIIETDDNLLRHYV